jgi:hypothetical protein
MKKFILGEMLVVLLILAGSDCSSLFAEIYKWTDDDGSVHFSDNASDVPKGKHPPVRRDETGINPASSPLKSTAPIAQQEIVEEDKVDPATEAQLQLIWKTLKNAILSGDIETALKQFVPGIQDHYRAVINDPSMKIVARFKEIDRLEVFTVTGKTAQAGAIRREAEGEFAYPVNFVKNFGEWKILGF